MISKDLIVTSTQQDVIYDRGRDWRARLGFITTPSDGVVEYELIKNAPEGVGINFARLPGSEMITTENALAWAEEIEDVSSRFGFPDDELKVVCFSCTSASALIGEDVCEALINKSKPKTKATTLIGSVIKALGTVEAKKIVIITPYNDDINTREAKYMVEQGFQVLDFEGMNIATDTGMRRVAPSYIKEFAKSIDCKEAQAIFISCGGLRSMEIVEELEQEVQKPVIASNHSMLWNCLRLAGIDDKIENFGRLFREH